MTPKEEYLRYYIMSTNKNNTIFAYKGRPTNVSEKITKQVVASKSESKYKNDNTIFILWLYYNQYLREEFIQDSLRNKQSTQIQRDSRT